MSRIVTLNVTDCDVECHGLWRWMSRIVPLNVTMCRWMAQCAVECHNEGNWIDFPNRGNFYLYPPGNSDWKLFSIKVKINIYFSWHTILIMVYYRYEFERLRSLKTEYRLAPLKVEFQIYPWNASWNESWRKHHWGPNEESLRKTRPSPDVHRLSRWPSSLTTRSWKEGSTPSADAGESKG